MLQVRIKKKLGNFLLDVDFSMDGGIFAILLGVLMFFV